MESAAAHAVSFASFFCALYLWLALRGFLAARVWELQDYEKALFPAVAWKVDKIGVPEYRTDPQALKPGDLCLARKGDLLPCDGLVERGVAVLWERTLSGRSSLRIRGVGEEVYAASSVVTGIVFRSSAEQKILVSPPLLNFSTRPVREVEFC